MKKTILVTGGAGFIGSALIRYLIAHTDHHIVNIDKLTYAANLRALASISANPRYHFEQIDIADQPQIQRIFTRYQPDIVMHLAAESHVDRSIHAPADFIQTNIVGTYVLLEQARAYYQTLAAAKQARFRFLHISTDEVYGDLPHPDHQPNPPLFTEASAYAPSSPYSASKAASDHLVRAWHKTYRLPILITHCANNYGPYQYPEKLIPRMLLNALAHQPLPLYGSGQQIRDWLHVDDHVRALYLVASQGRIGETYNIGAHNEQRNIDLVRTLCHLLDRLVPLNQTGRGALTSYTQLITYAPDRPGHDQRYAIDASKIQRQLGWTPQHTFQTGLQNTVQWYLDNPHW